MARRRTTGLGDATPSSRTPLAPDWAEPGHTADKAKPARLFILDLLLPADIAPDVHQNLCDLYPMWLTAHGKKRADIIYNAQVARIIFGCFCNCSLRSVERVLQSIRLIGPS